MICCSIYQYIWHLVERQFNRYECQIYFFILDLNFLWNLPSTILHWELSPSQIPHMSCLTVEFIFPSQPTSFKKKAQYASLPNFNPSFYNHILHEISQATNNYNAFSVHTDVSWIIIGTWNTIIHKNVVKCSDFSCEIGNTRQNA